jgi:preprotein translocase subunit SecA
MRLFGGVDRVSGLMERMGVEEGEVITHSMVTKAIERAQRRVEGHNFSIRKRLLEYDDVMNKQREVVYDIRRDALLEEDISAATREQIEEVVDDIVEDHTDPNEAAEYWDWPGLSLDFTSTFLVPVPTPEDERPSIGQEALRDQLFDAAMDAYRRKEERLTPPITRQLERHVTLRTIDELWKDHLHELDLLRSGIGLRAYGQKDPLLEYKRESFNLFEAMMVRVRRETVSRFFRYELAATPAPVEAVLSGGSQSKASATAYASAPAAQGGGEPAASAIGTGGGAPRGAFDGEGEGGPPAAGRPEPVRAGPKVGRNDPCPCGSGKKYKKCHGRT